MANTAPQGDGIGGLDFKRQFEDVENKLSTLIEQLGVFKLSVCRWPSDTVVTFGTPEWCRRYWAQLEWLAKAYNAAFDAFDKVKNQVPVQAVDVVIGDLKRVTFSEAVIELAGRVVDLCGPFAEATAFDDGRKNPWLEAAPDRIPESIDKQRWVDSVLLRLGEMVSAFDAETLRAGIQRELRKAAHAEQIEPEATLKQIIREKIAGLPKGKVAKATEIFKAVGGNRQTTLRAIREVLAEVPGSGTGNQANG